MGQLPSKGNFMSTKVSPFLLSSDENSDIDKLDKPIKCQCCPHIETSHQLTGFYMGATLVLDVLINGANLLIMRHISVPVGKKWCF